MLAKLSRKDYTPAQFESALKELIRYCDKFPFREPVMKHTLHEGIYIREMHAEPNTLIIGCQHKFASTAALVQGKMRYLTEKGFKDIEGYQLFQAEANLRRAALTITKCIFINIIRTDLTDLTEIEDWYLNDPSELLSRRKGDLIERFKPNCTKYLI